MTTIYENDLFRGKDKDLIVSELTNMPARAKVVEDCATLEDYLSKLTPGRRVCAEAAIALYKKLEEERVMREEVKGSDNIYKLMYPIIGNLEVEEFWTLFLNGAGKVISRQRISVGGINATMVDCRLIMKRALELNAISIIVCHNHPSGNRRPSNEDKNLTKKIKDMGDVMNIRLLDHVIVARDSYYSFNDEGDM